MLVAGAVFILLVLMVELKTLRGRPQSETLDSEKHVLLRLGPLELIILAGMFLTAPCLYNWLGLCRSFA